MDSKTPYLDAVATSLPSILSDLLMTFDIYSREKLDTLLRFSMGGSCPPRIQGHAGAWLSGQDRLRTRFQQLEPQALGKRSRNGELNGQEEERPSGSSKKQKVLDDSLAEDEGDDLYTLHSISITSPIRKKVNIAITSSTIRLTNAASNALESRIDLANIRRAFILSNLGKNKNKPRWSVVLLSADTSDKKDTSSQLQLTFSVEHAPSNAKDLFTTTSQSGEVTAHPKGTETLTYLQSFLSHLPSHIKLVTSPDPNSEIQPFLSTSAQPYVEAYRHAKEGALYLLETGILWAESRPAEFFALEDLAPDSDEPGMGGVKTLSATGRTLSLFVRRRAQRPRDEDGDEMDTEEEEIEGEETEFAMIDGREQENVLQWVRRYRRFFGKPREAQPQPHQTNGDVKGKGKAKATAEEVAAMNAEAEGSDASDEDYNAPSDSDGGEPSSDSDSEDEDEGGVSGDDDEAEDTDEEEEDEGMEDEEEELDPSRHPLMRPGAMPKMSKAAMDAAVKMVVGDMVGPEEVEDEEDELA